MSGSNRTGAEAGGGIAASGSGEPGTAWTFADIGGTNARFARWRADSGTGPIERWPADDFASLPDAVDAFERTQPLRARRAALAIALQVRGVRLRMTNRPWSFEAHELRRALGLDELRLVNDFVAAAAGLPALGDDVEVLREGTPGPGHWLLIGPGTGLGAAALLDAGGTLERVLASEAGHMGFAGYDPALESLRAAVRTRWTRVSWERLLSGEGLGVLHAWQAGADDLLPAPRISALVAAGDHAAIEAARWFSRLLGAFAGDLCLAFGADGGVWLTGGVLDGLGAGFDRPAFLEAFDDKGRYAARQSEVPVRHVLAGDLAFRGLARIVSGASRAPGIVATEQSFDERS